ncbi:MAG: relaxase MobL, partial [Clostridia bacterium]|nr:relaxase MobL [Clostridia bacterium]
MPRLVVVSRYLKSGSSKNLSNYVKYIATREGAAKTKENYIGYLANRPGAVKFGSHGLFSQNDEPIVLDKAAKEVAEHKGNVWTHIVSLRRDDAQKMGYDNLTAWRELIKRQITGLFGHFVLQYQSDILI